MKLRIHSILFSVLYEIPYYVVLTMQALVLLRPAAPPRAPAQLWTLCTPTSLGYILVLF